MLGWITKLFRSQNIGHPAQLVELFSQIQKTAAGINVTPDKAMTVPAINRGVHLLSDMVGMLPLPLYRRDGRYIEKARDHELWRFIRKKPSSFTNAYQFRYAMQRHLLLRGNAYAFKNKIGGVVKDLTIIHPSRVTIEQDDNLRIRYIVSFGDGQQKTYGPDKIWHLRAHTEDGIVGKGFVQEAPESIAMCVAAEMHGAMLFGNGAKPGGVISTDKPLKKEQIEMIVKNFKEAYGGGNKYGTAVLDNGFKWEQTGMDNEKAQYLGVRAFQVTEAARLLNVPPILLYHSDTASTFASSKELVQAFLKFSLDPWLTFWETSYDLDILPEDIQEEYFVKFTRQVLERMDLLSRVKAYNTMIASRTMNPNEARELEEMNPYEGGDEFVNPNITQLKTGSDPEGEDEK